MATFSRCCADKSFAIGGDTGWEASCHYVAYALILCRPGKLVRDTGWVGCPLSPTCPYSGWVLELEQLVVHNPDNASCSCHVVGNWGGLCYSPALSHCPGDRYWNRFLQENNTEWLTCISLSLGGGGDSSHAGRHLAGPTCLKLGTGTGYH